MDIYVILILVFLSSSIGMYLILAILSPRPGRVSERIRHLENLSGSLENQYLSMNESERRKLDPKVSNLLAELTRHIKGNDTSARKKLSRAGYRNENAIHIFFGMKFLLSLCLFIPSLIFLFIRNPGLKSLLISAATGLSGYYFPDIILHFKIKKRQNSINYGLPDTLDFLVICVEAGLGLNSALVRVGKEMVLKSKELSEELLLVNQEMRSGLSREQALYNLSDRNGSKYLRILVSAIVISDRLGSDIANTLRAQSDSIRTHYRQQAEEQAAKAGIKMLLPLVLFILPTLFIVILGPAFIKIVNEVLPHIQK